MRKLFESFRRFQESQTQNPMLAKSSWDEEDASVAIDWELEQGESESILKLVKYPQIARAVVSGKKSLPDALSMLPGWQLIVDGSNGGFYLTKLLRAALNLSLREAMDLYHKGFPIPVKLFNFSNFSDVVRRNDGLVDKEELESANNFVAMLIYPGHAQEDVKWHFEAVREP